MSNSNIAKNVAAFNARMIQLKSHRNVESADMQAVIGNGKRASVFEFTQAISDACDKWALDTEILFSLPQKQIKRFVQFVHAVNAKDYKAVDVTTATILYALQIAGDNPLTVDALHYIGAGLKAGKISPETRGVSRMSANKLFGRVGLSTIPTQASRTVGKNGFLQVVGATVGEPGKVNQKVTLNSGHPMVTAFFAMMQQATEKNMGDMVGEA